MSFLDLDDRATQLRLAQGSVMLRVRHLDDDDNFEVDTPNLAFALVRTGEYRVDVDPNGDTTVITVWQGQGEATGGGYSYRVLAGQRARFSGLDELSHDISRVPDYDDFENWAFDRDRRDDRLESENYVSPEMTGYDDLDDYGRWNYIANYGNVWVPSGVPQGWAPYRNGHWDYIQPWGWTWVEDEPWGFAPFHYGRWAYANNYWCWVPGPVVRASRLCAGAGGVRRRKRICPRRRACGGMVSACARRSVRTRISREPRLCATGERNQHRRERHSSHECVQHLRE